MWIILELYYVHHSVTKANKIIFFDHLGEAGRLYDVHIKTKLLSIYSELCVVEYG